MSAKRNLICAALVVFSAIVLVSVLVFNYHPRGKPIKDLKKDEKEIEEIISSRTETDERLETGVLFNGIELPYDEAGRTYYYSLPENSSSAYTPEVSAKGGVRLAFISGKITDEQIAAGEPLEAIVYNDGEFGRIKIVCTTLPVISITTGSEISSEYSSMSMRVYDNRTEATKRLAILKGKIHTRGNTSLRFDKKAYRISLRDMSPGRNMRELDVSLLGMRKDNAEALLQNVQQLKIEFGVAPLAVVESDPHQRIVPKQLMRGDFEFAFVAGVFQPRVHVARREMGLVTRRK